MNSKLVWVGGYTLEPLLNVLPFNVIKIGISYLHNIREEEV